MEPKETSEVETTDEETKVKKPFYKKWYFWVIIILILIILGGNSDSPEDTSVEDDQEQVQEETVAVDSSTQEYIDQLRTEVLPLMQLSNDRIIAAGEAGANAQFDAAEAQISSGKRFLSQAQTEFGALTATDEARTLHDLLDRAFDKFDQALELYEVGITTVDADTIYEGVTMYQEGTDLVSQAADELDRLQGNE